LVAIFLTFILEAQMKDYKKMGLPELCFELGRELEHLKLHLKNSRSTNVVKKTATNKRKPKSAPSTGGKRKQTSAMR
jgi:hypothetical protein